MAGHGAPVPAGIGADRRAGDLGIPDGRRPVLRRHQPGGRSPLCRDRSAAAQAWSGGSLVLLPAPSPPWRQVLRRSPAAAGAAFVLALLVGGALFAPWLVQTNPYDLAALDLLDSHLPPAFLAGGDARYLLGTDSQGADLLSLILYGLRASLMVALFAVALSVALGTAAGLVSGYLEGLVDSVLMRLADIQFTFPALLLALLIGGISQKLLADAARAAMAVPILVLALGIAHWPHFARLVRGAVLCEGQKAYVAAARLAGRGHFYIIL